MYTVARIAISAMHQWLSYTYLARRPVTIELHVAIYLGTQ